MGRRYLLSGGLVAVKPKKADQPWVKVVSLFDCPQSR